MKHEDRNEMLRWRDRAADGTAAEDRAAALIAGALSPVEPSSHKLARVGRELLSPRRRQRPSRLLFRAAIVAAAMIAGAATVKAYEMARRSGWFGLPSPATSNEQPKAPASRTAAKPRRAEAAGTKGASDEPTIPAVVPASDEPKTPPSAQSPSASAAPTAELPSNSAPSLPPEPRRTGTVAPRVSPQAQRSLAHRTVTAQEAHRDDSRPQLAAERTTLPQPQLQPTPSAPPPLAVSPSPLPPPTTPARAALPPAAPPAPPVPPAPSASDEVRALDRAMTLLRRDHDGLAALSAIDTYLARYPHGLLRREAHFARVDALLLLGRSDQALADLEVLPLDRGRRSTELQVIRAELRARNSCASAIADFGAALSQSPSAGLLERILYGRGVCRSKLGDIAGAVEDLGRYVDRFPNGAHARSAQKWIETIENSRNHKNAP